jgi:succinyl-CoA synthetase beta subunit
VLKLVGMARKKLSEWKAKTLVSQMLQISYNGISLHNASDVTLLDENSRYVVKVDEGIKKRMKKELVGLDRTPQEVQQDIERFMQQGYTYFIVEPFVPHEQSSEKYLSIERVRDGLQILYSEKGGIDVEENAESIKKIVVPNGDFGDSITKLQNDLGVAKDFLLKLVEAFEKYYFSFLEINPLVVEDGNVYFLDIAAEVDSAGEFFVQGAWTEEDFRSAAKTVTKEENNVAELSQKSQASFNLTVLNPNGAIFMLLSGGGASIVLADEVYDLGYGKLLANYGEYSGNPNAEEVYLYTKNILELLIASNSTKKVLIIGGGVANFTNIAITFKGVIRALEEKKDTLQQQGVTVFVRRGGPNQEEGLAMIEKFLRDNNLYGLVADQRTTLPEIVKEALKNLKVESETHSPGQGNPEDINNSSL